MLAKHCDSAKIEQCPMCLYCNRVTFNEEGHNRSLLTVAVLNGQHLSKQCSSDLCGTNQCLVAQSFTLNETALNQCGSA